MNTELKTPMARGAQSECSTCDDPLDKVVHRPMPPLDRTRVKRLETPEEITRALRIAPTRTNRTSQRIVVVLGTLVIICVVMAAIVWWRLLT